MFCSGDAKTKCKICAYPQFKRRLGLQIFFSFAANTILYEERFHQFGRHSGYLINRFSEDIDLFVFQDVVHGDDDILLKFAIANLKIAYVVHLKGLLDQPGTMCAKFHQPQA